MVPRKAPYLRNASIAYCEHVGENRQLDGNRGESSSWYARIATINICRGIPGIERSSFMATNQ